jgi:hypothetical protein
MKQQVRSQGEGAVVHGNSGRHPANYTEESLRRRIVVLKKTDPYDQTNFAYFRELLEERETITIGYTALRGILKEAGIVSPKTHRGSGRKFRRRTRKSRFGEMLQADATPFDWFGTGKRLALHGFIDDATGQIVALHFCANECLMGYLELMRQTLTQYGIPLELYADKAGIFFVNTKKQENWSVEEQLAGKALSKTQFGAIAEKLGVQLTSAHTPQAKGRVERLWQTLQDRLPVYFKLTGIATMEQANAALPVFIADFNHKFSVVPASTDKAFVPLSPEDDLDTFLAVQFERTTDNCGCFSFNNLVFQVVSKIALPKKKIRFVFSERLGFKAYYDHHYYPVIFKGYANNRGGAYLPNVTKALLQKYYLTDGKALGEAVA